MQVSFDAALSRIVDVIANRGACRRHITALAGPPGAGKSTVAAAMVRALDEREPGSAAVLQMDGYHYDDRVLRQRGVLGRKGAPETFDVGGLAAMLARLKVNREDEIAVPVFDRDIEIARAGAQIIPAAVRHLVVEGNYLLLNGSPWRALQGFFDTTVFVTADLAVLRQRLEARWSGQGLSAREIAGKVERNDLVNARLVLGASVPSEFVLMSGTEGAPG